MKSFETKNNALFHEEDDQHNWRVKEKDRHKRQTLWKEFATLEVLMVAVYMLFSFRGGWKRLSIFRNWLCKKPTFCDEIKYMNNVTECGIVALFTRLCTWLVPEDMCQKELLLQNKLYLIQYLYPARSEYLINPLFYYDYRGSPEISSQNIQLM